MIGKKLGMAGALAPVVLIACLDVEGGDRGTYGSPCGSGFRALLLCDRESGGADPGASLPGQEPSGPATCADACEVLIVCQGGDPGNVGECAAECSADAPPQSLLDCIVELGCGYPACFGEG